MVSLLFLLLAAEPQPAAPPPAEAATPAVSSFDAPEPDPDPWLRSPTPVTPAHTLSPAVLRIQAAERGATLSVSAQAPGWSRTCPAPVTVDRPCNLAAVPEQQLVDLRITGTHTFDSKILVEEGTTTVVITHRGYTVTAVGVMMFLASLGILAEGVSTAQSGDRSDARTLLTVGASVEALGLILILADLTGTHNHVVAVP